MIDLLGIFSDVGLQAGVILGPRICPPAVQGLTAGGAVFILRFGHVVALPPAARLKKLLDQLDFQYATRNAAGSARSPFGLRP